MSSPLSTLTSQNGLANKADTMAQDKTEEPLALVAHDRKKTVQDTSVVDEDYDDC